VTKQALAITKSKTFSTTNPTATTNQAEDLGIRKEGGCYWSGALVAPAVLLVLPPDGIVPFLQSLAISPHGSRPA